MKIYALALFLFLTGSLAGVTFLGIAALQEVSATETMEAILAALEEPANGSNEATRLAAGQMVFGERQHQRWLFQVGTVGLLALAGFIFFAIVGYRRLIGPLQHHAARLVSNQTELESLGEFEELAGLVRAFNGAQTALKEKERSEVARYVVHQMKNLWTPVRLAAESLGRIAVDDTTREVSELLSTQMQKANRLLTLFQGLYTFPEPRHQNLKWEPSIRSWLKDTLIPLDIRVQAGAETGQADPFLMGQSLENLVRNAWEAQGQAGGPIEIEIAPGILSVLDRGCGFTGNGKPRGLRLGLSFARRTAEALAMVLEHEDRPGGGSIVTLKSRSTQ